MLDHTHDIQTLSWVKSAQGHEAFPLQNLPMGVFIGANGVGRIGVAIGDEILDLPACIEAGLLSSLQSGTRETLGASTLNTWMALSQADRVATRQAVFDVLADGNGAAARAAHILRPAEQCEMMLPSAIGDYTDFYAGVHHATKVGRLFRPDCPLMPNYKHMPIAYQGRASSIRVSGSPVRRPLGQVKLAGGPQLQLTDRLDFELELAIWAGAGNALGESIPIARAPAHIAGYGLFNDWSARDIQAWEYQPLGPFQGKNFASTISPWIVTSEALTPFRIPAMSRGTDDPQIESYLLDDDDQRLGGLGIELEVFLSSVAMRRSDLPELRISRSHAQHLYWTPAQMVVQHTLNGCDLRSGDLLGSGTISTPNDEGNGSLLEMTAGGTQAVVLPTGEKRMFLCDGDEIIFRARAHREGFNPVGFGECRARVLPSQWANGADFEAEQPFTQERDLS
ncbi:fumarylacetoacetase [Alcaligenaceae bacterium]|nr:fumarylacetoacetase [Alcaligenaceae bacterium]